MVCVPTAATDNDIISSFPGWTKRVSGRAPLCSTLTLKGCCVFWHLRPIIVGLPLILTEQRAPTHWLLPVSSLFGDCEPHTLQGNFATFAHGFTKESQQEVVRLNI